MKECLPFGPKLREERLKRGIPLWKFAASVPFPTSNVQRIERGITEPRIGIAMKMLATLGVDPGDFMQNLADGQDWPHYEIPDGFSGDTWVDMTRIVQSERVSLADGSKLMFGYLFKRARVACNLTQAVVATRANYTVRSLIAVENGRQEPMVMRALQLVWVTGVSVHDFFDRLAVVSQSE